MLERPERAVALPILNADAAFGVTIEVAKFIVLRRESLIKQCCPVVIKTALESFGFISGQELLR
jgi:hypothetical protein